MLYQVQNCKEEVRSKKKFAVRSLLQTVLAANRELQSANFFAANCELIYITYSINQIFPSGDFHHA